MSEAVTMPSLIMMTSIISEESLARATQADRHIDRRTDGQTDGQTDRQTDINTHTLTRGPLT